MSTVKRLVCDVRDCPDDAIFQIGHFMVLTRPDGVGANLHFDLCERHAEAFVITGRGAWAMGDNSVLEPSRGW